MGLKRWRLSPQKRRNESSLPTPDHSFIWMNFTRWTFYAISGKFSSYRRCAKNYASIALLEAVSTQSSLHIRPALLSEVIAEVRDAWKS